MIRPKSIKNMHRVVIKARSRLYSFVSIFSSPVIKNKPNYIITCFIYLSNNSCSFYIKPFEYPPITSANNARTTIYQKVNIYKGEPDS
jgi:hypothetical protein